MTQTTTIANSKIVIERWRNTFVLTEDSYRRPATRDLLDRIDRKLVDEIPHRCGERLTRWVDGTAEGLWLIREMNLNFVLDVSKPGADDVAPAWTEQFAAGLVEAMNRGPDNNAGVLYFEDRATYIAQFVLDLIAGSAWNKWFYEEFRPLAMLPVGRAIAELLGHEPEEGAAAIIRFAKAHRVDEFLAALNERDARTIYQCCFGPSLATSSDVDFSSLTDPQQQGPSSTQLLWVGRLLAMRNEEPLHTHASGQGLFHQALRWLALVVVRYPDVEVDASLCSAVEGLIELRRVLEEIRSPIIADGLARALVEGSTTLNEAINLASARGVPSPAEGLRFLIAAARGDHDWAVQAAAVLLRDQSTPVHAVLSGESMISSFAGMFLLCPALLRWNEWLETVTGESEQAKDIARFLRHIVLVKCAGGARACEAAGDPALRLLSACHRTQLHEGERAFPEFDAQRAHVSFTKHLLALTDCEARCLIAETISISQGGREVLLLRDAVRNEWLYAAAVPAEAGAREEALTAAVNHMREATDSIPTVLLSPSAAAFAESANDPELTDRMIKFDPDSDFSKINESLLMTGSIESPISSDQYAQLLLPSSREFSYFSFLDFWPDFGLELDLLGSLLARAVMRSFARHLMGFHGSSPQHLYQNFLEGVGTVHSQSDRIEVELPRSPLLMVLQLSGLTRQTFTLPWLEGKEVCLLPPKE